MNSIYSNTRCIDGRTFRHDPQHNDPDLETDIGRCSECEGQGCEVLERRAEAEQIIGEKIVTHFWMKPIPPRQFDWVAYKDNDEPDDDGHMLQGWGATEAEAIADLLERIEESVS